MRKLLLGACLMAIGLVSAHPARAQVLKKTLPNGLTVLARENHAAPVVAVRIYVRTGSIYEGKFLGAGLSHLFEHTLFEGTTTQDKKTLNDEIAAIGGQSNAYTSYDVTAYHITTAKPYFGRALGVLSDMVQHANFPDAQVKVQQGVIHNEMNLDSDDPDRELGELWDRTAFLNHPVRYPIIGFPAQFDALTRADILDYYKSHYTPENTVVSVAGDVSAPQVFEQVEKELGDWPRGIVQRPVLPTEPLQTAPRKAETEKAVNLTYLQMGWHTVPLQSNDLYPLDVLASVLGGSESSRLPLELQQRRNLVTGVSAYSNTPNYDAGSFAVRAIMPPANLPKVENAVRAQVAALRVTPVTPAELARAKRQIQSSFVLGSQDVESQAEQAAYDELGTGDPNYSRLYVARIQAVTAAQMLAVAKKYLDPDGLTTAVVKPLSKATTKPIADTTEGETTEATTLALAPSITTLPNGVRLILRPSKANPSVSIVVTGLGGVRAENPFHAGIANLTSTLLTRGTTTRSGEQISALVDDLGGSMSPFSGYNSWGIESQWLAGDWFKGLNLVAESVLTPTFPQDELDKAKVQIASGLDAQEDDPMSAASLLLRRLFYGNHPYSRSTLGTLQSVKPLTRTAVVSFWDKLLNPKNTVVAIYGDFDPAQVQKAATLAFGRFKAKDPAFKIAAPAVATLPNTASRTIAKEGVVQTAMWYGFPSIDVKNEDRYAIDVLDAAMSGADLPGGRLHERLRENELVYVVHAYDSPGLGGGMFVIYAATTKPNEPKVKAIIAEEVNKVRSTDISDAELERAKSMSISAHAIDSQTNSAQARAAATNELYGLGANDEAQYAAKINAVTLADVRRMAQKYLVPSQSALAIVEPK